MLIRRASRESALRLVRAGRSIHVLGDRGSGRSSFLKFIAEKLETDGYQPIMLRGVSSLSHVPLASLQLALDFNPSTAKSGTLNIAAEKLRSRIGKENSAIIVDDWDGLDQASTGVIEFVAEECGIPLAVSGRFLTGASSFAGRFLTIELGTITISELGAILTRRLRDRVDPSVTRWAFMLSGGKMGLACQLVDASVAEQAIVLEHTGWSKRRNPSRSILQRVAEAYLDSVPDADRRALSTVAAAEAPMAVPRVRELIAETSFQRLSSQGLLRIHQEHEPQVFVYPPLLADYFETRFTPASGATLSGRLGLEGGKDWAFPPIADLALVTQQADQRINSCLPEAETTWRLTPDPRRALLYLNVLVREHDAGRIEEVLQRTVYSPEGDDDDEATAKYLRWKASWRLRGDGCSLHEVVDALRSMQHLSANVQLYLAETATILTSLRSVVPVPQEPMTAPADAPVWLAEIVLESRLTTLIARGQSQTALGVYDTFVKRWGVPRDAPVRALHSFALLIDGQFQRAEREIARELIEATRLCDVKTLSVFTSVQMRLTLMAGNRKSIRDLVSNVTAISAVVRLDPQEEIFIAGAAAAAGAQHWRTLPGAQWDPETPCAPPNGLLPGQMMEWTPKEESQPPWDADAIWAAAESLWDRGARTPAAFGFLVSVRIRLVPQRLRITRERVQHLEARLFLPYLDYLALRVEGDTASLLEIIDRLVTLGWVGAAVVALNEAESSTADQAMLRKIQDRRRLLLAEFSSTDQGGELIASEPLRLTRREQQVAHLIAGGRSNASIAAQLVVSSRTVEGHVLGVLRKTRCHSRSDFQERVRTGRIQLDS